MTFLERNEQEKLLYEAFKGIKYRNYDEQQGLEADFLTQFTDTAIHMIISQMISKGIKISNDNEEFIEDLDELQDNIHHMMGGLDNGYVNNIVDWIDRIRQKWRDKK